MNYMDADQLNKINKYFNPVFLYFMLGDIGIQKDENENDIDCECNYDWKFTVKILFRGSQIATPDICPDCPECPECPECPSPTLEKCREEFKDKCEEVTRERCL